MLYLDHENYSMLLFQGSGKTHSFYKGNKKPVICSNYRSFNFLKMLLFQGSGKTHTVYKGNKKPVSKECVLIIDHETGTFTLERLSNNVTVKKTRYELYIIGPDRKKFKHKTVIIFLPISLNIMCFVCSKESSDTCVGVLERTVSLRRFF